MKQFAYRKINAFTREGSLGNPAAYLDLGDELLRPEQMLAVAKEHAGFVSEFMFLSRRGGRLKLTYYSSEGELAFCGHGTIAVMRDQIELDSALMALSEIEIDTNMKGRLTVYNRIASEASVFISSPEPIYYECKLSPADLADAFQADRSIISLEHPIDLIDAGLRTLIVPISGLQNELSLFPDRARLEAFCVANEVDIILIFTKETVHREFFAHSRVFAPRFGYLEDPATGSGNSAFGRYLLKNRIWNGESISVEQGGNDRVFNEVRLLRHGEALLFGGKSTKTIDGQYFLA